MRRRCYEILVVVFVFFQLSTTANVAAQLIPRIPMPKPATITKPAFPSQLKLKFRDDLKVRAHPDGTLISLTGGDLSNVDVVRTQYGLTFEQLIKLPQATLDRVQIRAGQRSRIAQPDLGGMMLVRGPEATIEAAAQALLALAETE